MLMLAVLVSGCEVEAPEGEQVTNMNTDIIELKRLIELPGEVAACEWQTGEFAPSADWWLAAVFQVDQKDIGAFLQGPENEEYIQTPPGMSLSSSFSGLEDLRDAQLNDSGQLSAIAVTYSAEPYASSPLLNGKAVRLGDDQVLVMLWTR
jgi:hypothetical protein